MQYILLFTIALLQLSDADEYIQSVQIDTSKTLIESTPLYTESGALYAHLKLEEELSQGKLDIEQYFYLLFQYREPGFVSLWKRVLEERKENPLLRVWFLNALVQIGGKEHLPEVLPYLQSENSLIRECAINAYGFLGEPKDTTLLIQMLASEKNSYCRESIKAALSRLQRGVQTPIIYLPKLYPQGLKRSLFFYNCTVQGNDLYRYSDYALTDSQVPLAEHFIMPTQQFYNHIKHTPEKVGTFGNGPANKIHTGFDGAWMFQGLPVHVIADGIVRAVSHELTWGTLLVIESALPEEDTICTIYGHLSRFINVKAGDTVYAGQTIGQIGSSVSYENGGYWAHLHLGIAKGSMHHAQIAGYSNKTDAYENPLLFIESRKKKK